VVVAVPDRAIRPLPGATARRGGYNGGVNDHTVAGEQPRRSSRPGPSARHDDPGALAKADVRAILARALGLRRIVELAAETVAGQAATVHPDPSRSHRPRPV